MSFRLVPKLVTLNDLEWRNNHSRWLLSISLGYRGLLSSVNNVTVCDMHFTVRQPCSDVYRWTFRFQICVLCCVVWINGEKITILSFVIIIGLYQSFTVGQPDNRVMMFIHELFVSKFVSYVVLFESMVKKFTIISTIIGS